MVVTNAPTTNERNTEMSRTLDTLDELEKALRDVGAAMSAADRAKTALETLVKCKKRLDKVVADLPNNEELQAHLAIAGYIMPTEELESIASALGGYRQGQGWDHGNESVHGLLWQLQDALRAYREEQK